MFEFQQQIAIALLPISLFGAVINWSILYSIHRLTSFNHSFGYLSGNQALADALHSTTFLLYFCPMVLLDQPIMKMYSHHCGFVLLFCYELSVLTHFMISLNRFIAVWRPYQYKKLFSDGTTKVMITCIWIYTGAVAILFYENFCYFYYDENIQFLTFTNTEFCGKIGWYGDFLKNATIVALVSCLDILTVIKVRRSSRKVMDSINKTTQNNYSRREIRFLKQTVCQGGVFMLELLTYFFVPQYFENKWIVFLATSFAWVAVHAADGLVVIACNPDIRRFMFRGNNVRQSETITSNAQ